MRHAFVHTVIDDHSRVAYAEIHDDETAATAIGVLRRAVSWFAARGVTVERVLSDIQAGWATLGLVRRPAAGSVLSGTRPSSLLDRVERIGDFLPVDRVGGRGHCREFEMPC